LSFTFPLGAVVTGTSELALVSRVDALKYIAVVPYVAVVCAWVVVAGRTVATSMRDRASEARPQQKTRTDTPTG
jgi:tellurite resistance protein TehA-like permease